MNTHFPHVLPSSFFPEIFGEFSGIALEDGERWHNFRSKVQQDMMRPKSATFYLDKIQAISDEFVQYIRRKRDPQGLEVGKRKEQKYWGGGSIAQR